MSSSEHRDDADHIRSYIDPELTLCSQRADGLNVLPSDTTMLPDGGNACSTCWGVQRDRLSLLGRPE